jgi:general secretion pathway protein C
MLARLSAFAIWAVVVASLMYWALRLIASPPAAPDYTVAVEQGTRGDLARIFGPSSGPASAAVAAAPTPQASSRFKLVGVAAPRDSQSGVGLALISVDGKAPRAINVGRTIDEGWVLQSVSRRGAKLSSNLGADMVELEMPALPLPTRGVPGSQPAVPAATPGLPPTAGGVRPPVAIPSPTPAPVAPPSTATAPPAAAVPGGPPGILVPQEELKRARERPLGGVPGGVPGGAPAAEE